MWPFKKTIKQRSKFQVCPREEYFAIIDVLHNKIELNIRNDALIAVHKDGDNMVLTVAHLPQRYMLTGDWTIEAYDELKSVLNRGKQ